MYYDSIGLIPFPPRKKDEADSCKFAPVPTHRNTVDHHDHHVTVAIPLRSKATQSTAGASVPVAFTRHISFFLFALPKNPVTVTLRCAVLCPSHHRGVPDILKAKGVVAMPVEVLAQVAPGLVLAK